MSTQSLYQRRCWTPAEKIGKFIGKNAAEIASKAAEANIKSVAKEVVEKVAPDPIDYAKKLAASARPSNALINEIQRAGVKVTAENVLTFENYQMEKLFLLNQEMVLLVLPIL